MGDNHSDYDDEKPIHPVKLDSFYMAAIPVTQKLWQAVTGENPSSHQGDDRPVEMVSWLDVNSFIERLNKRSQMLFRLPTEAEWEYAARGGRLSEGYRYTGSDRLRQVGWYNENSNLETKEVGQLRPNELGLYDMSGNVWEWCEDWYAPDYYAACQRQGLIENPRDMTAGTSRVVRGGSYFDGAAYCRCAYRDGYGPVNRSDDIGFRLVGVLPSVG